MNTKIFKLALGVAFSIAGLSASAQKTINEGVIVYNAKSAAGETDAKVYFRGDSSTTSFPAGPAQIKLVANNKGTYFAILVNVPIASMKNVAVLTPDELEQGLEAAPKLSFTPGSETKVINGFNCKKVAVKDSKGTLNFDAWVTNDINAPENLMSKYFEGAGGFPVQFTTIQQGQAVALTLKSINGEKVPAGTFGIPSDYTHITYEELMALSGKH